MKPKLKVVHTILCGGHSSSITTHELPNATNYLNWCYTSDNFVNPLKLTFVVVLFSSGNTTFLLSFPWHHCWVLIQTTQSCNKEACKTNLRLIWHHMENFFGKWKKNLVTLLMPAQSHAVCYAIQSKVKWYLAK